MTTPEGMIILESPLPPKLAIDRFRSAVEAAGMKVFSLIDFSADAKAVGIPMEDAVLLIFGNPKVGTLLLLDAPHSGIDLPLKAFAWTHEGRHRLSYNEPEHIARRHGLASDGPIRMMSEALKRAASTVLRDPVHSDAEELK